MPRPLWRTPHHSGDRAKREAPGSASEGEKPKAGEGQGHRDTRAAGDAKGDQPGGRFDPERMGNEKTGGVDDVVDRLAARRHQPIAQKFAGPAAAASAERE